MAQDAVKAADGMSVDKDPVVAAADEARKAALRDELKAAKDRVRDAEKALKALEKEAQGAK